MDAFKVLEEKIVLLVERIAALKKENESLQECNKQLQAKVAVLEESLLSDTHKLDKLHAEQEVTKMVVDDLIKNIDSLIEFEK